MLPTGEWIDMEYEIKTEGAIIPRASGMTREDKSHKIRYDLIPHFLLYRLAMVYTKGAKNHEPRNWEKASTEEDLDLFVQGAWRHFMQFLKGEVDEDHFAALMFNLAGIVLVREKLGRNK